LNLPSAEEISEGSALFQCLAADSAARASASSGIAKAARSKGWRFRRRPERWREHGGRDATHRLVTIHLRLVAKIAVGCRAHGLPAAGRLD
jgi:DNA-directed RNA polymerase sigma subunit (sigma70/sigma32)